ncbi:hypothetical protein BKA62DRAFT_655874 [Auriculariales sp. MPI-PUGE-AT-0066]|nr:hypothetical protein BKA62DRAFT_655874 [Auriculariales sp. MPI-PUGE-AT-0066]
MSAYTGLTRQPSTSSSGSSAFVVPQLKPSHLRQTSSASASRRASWRVSGNWDSSGEMIEAKAHPGGVLKGLATRRAFGDIILPMQSQARRYIALQRLRSQHSDVILPTRPPQSLEKTVVTVAQQLAAAAGVAQTLRKRFEETEILERDARKRYQDKQAQVDGLQNRVDGLRGEAVSEVELANLRERLARAEAEEAKRDVQIERLLAQLKDVERRSYDAATDAKSVSRALERAREGMELRLHAGGHTVHEELPQAGSSWAAIPSSTISKLDRTKRSPKAPSHRVGLTVQIPGSESRTAISPGASAGKLPRSASMRVRHREPIDSGLLSAKNASRFSMPPTPQSSKSPTIRVTIVRQREVLASDTTQKTREKAQQALQALYHPSTPNGATSPAPGASTDMLTSLQEEDEEFVEGEALPEFARDLINQFGRSTDDLTNDLHVGDAKILATITRGTKQITIKPSTSTSSTSKQRPQHDRKESKLLKVFGLR